MQSRSTCHSNAASAVAAGGFSGPGPGSFCLHPRPLSLLELPQALATQPPWASSSLLPCPQAPTWSQVLRALSLCPAFLGHGAARAGGHCAVPRGPHSALQVGGSPLPHSHPRSASSWAPAQSVGREPRRASSGVSPLLEPLQQSDSSPPPPCSLARTLPHRDPIPTGSYFNQDHGLLLKGPAGHSHPIPRRRGFQSPRSESITGSLGPLPRRQAPSPPTATRAPLCTPDPRPD